MQKETVYSIESDNQKPIQEKQKNVHNSKFNNKYAKNHDMLQLLENRHKRLGLKLSECKVKTTRSKHTLL